MFQMIANGQKRNDIHCLVIRHWIRQKEEHCRGFYEKNKPAISQRLAQSHDGDILPEGKMISVDKMPDNRKDYEVGRYGKEQIKRIVAQSLREGRILANTQR